MGVPPADVGCVVSGLDDIFEVPIEHPFVFGDVEQLGDRTSGGWQRRICSEPVGVVIVPDDQDHLPIGGADVVADIVGEPAAEHVPAAVEREHGEGAHPLVDVDEWLDGLF